MDFKPNRKTLNELGLDDSIVFENPDYDSAIVGYDANDYRIIYDYQKMIEDLIETNGMSYEDAVDFIEYNTLRSIPYAGDKAPIVMHNMEDYFDTIECFEKKSTNEPYTFNAKEQLNNCISWVREWFENNGKGCKAVLGVSGGKDSTIMAFILAKALGPENVIGVSMPEYFQGDNDAKEICEYLGIEYIKCPIGDPVDGIMVNAMEGLHSSLSHQTKQNIPARIRMVMLYAISQTVKGRVVGTTNLDERLTGYFTKYGDGLACDLEPIEMFTVSEIIEFGKLLGIPDKWLLKTPSADLPNTKTDEEELGFSYKDFDTYIRETVDLPKETIEKIEDRINKNSFKLRTIAHFEPNLKIRKYGNNSL